MSRTLAPVRLPIPSPSRDPVALARWFDDGLAAFGAGQAFLAAPFDAMRSNYASAVLAGLSQRSLLASARLERALDALETLILGPLARRR